MTRRRTKAKWTLGVRHAVRRLSERLRWRSACNLLMDRVDAAAVRKRIAATAFYAMRGHGRWGEGDPAVANSDGMGFTRCANEKEAQAFVSPDGMGFVACPTNGEAAQRRSASMPAEAEADALLMELGCEMWQICRHAQGWVERMDGGMRRRAGTRLDWGRGRLEEILAQRGIVIQDRTGRVWDDGDPVDVVNAPAEAQSGASIITCTLEPVVLCKGDVRRRGKVTIATGAGGATA